MSSSSVGLRSSTVEFFNDKVQQRMSSILLVTILASCFSASTALIQAPYFTSFEFGQESWGVLVRDWACPCPSASFSFENAAAKRSGNAGIAVSVTVPSDQGWHVQTWSPHFNLTANHAYTACVWLRASAPLGGAAFVSFNLLKTDTYDGLGWAGTEVSTNWVQLCMNNVILEAAAVAYFTIDFGLNTGNIFVDDFSVTLGELPSLPSPSPPPSSPAVLTSLLETSFESGQESWRTLVRNWQCPCPEATFNFASTAAAHNGSTGVAVNVQVASNEGWHVQLQSPHFNVVAGARYTVCVWLRSEGAGAGNGNLWMSMLTAEQFAGLGWVPGTVTTNWAELCMVGVQPSANAKVYVTIDLGNNTGTYYVDDFKVTVNGNATSSSPSNDGSRTAPYSTSYENGEAGWISSTKATDCPCPAATFDFSSTAALRTGSKGVEITVQAPSTERWHVQLQSPHFALNTSFMYTACVWLRTPGGLTAGNHVGFVMLDTVDFAMFTSGQGQATSVWSQVCLMDFRPDQDTTAFFTLDLGRFVGTVYVDDFTLTARSDYTAEELTYVSAGATASRIDTHRKGGLTFRFLNATTGQPITEQLSRLELRLARHDFPFGTAIEWYVPADNRSWYLERAKHHFNALVPEWSFKWPDLEPTKDDIASRYNYLMSNHVQFAADNDFVMARGHTLEWLIPDPHFAGHWSRQDGCAAYRSYLEHRIKREVTNFKGKFNSYDVFNEINHDRNFVENCPGMWPGIMHDGVRWAHEVDPDAQLCINDYGLITGDDWQSMILYVSDMLQAGVPINCVGVQAYVPRDNRPSPAYMRTRLEALASLGVDIVITEFNFWTTWEGGSPEWTGTEEEHAALYEEYVPFWFSLPYVKGILMWNFWDGSNWITNGGIYRLDGTPKLSALAIDDMWNNRWCTNVALTDVALPNGEKAVNGFYGKYNYTLEVNGRLLTGVVNFPRSAGGSQTVTISLA